VHIEKRTPLVAKTCDKLATMTVHTKNEIIKHIRNFLIVVVGVFLFFAVVTLLISYAGLYLLPTSR